MDSANMRGRISAILDKLSINSIIVHKSLFWEFVKKDINGRFAGSIGGLCWTFINPLFSIILYSFIFSQVLKIRVTVQETGTDSFFIFFLAGYFPWIFISESLNRSIGTLTDNSGLITKVVFPVELLPITTVLSTFIVHLLGLTIFLLYLLVSGLFQSNWIFVCLIIPLQFLFTLGLGKLFSSLSVFVRDTQEILGLLLMVWFYATPIVYPISMVPDEIQQWIALNPMHLFVELYRDAIIGNPMNWITFAIALLISISSYIIGAKVFSILKDSFGDVL